MFVDSQPADPGIHAAAIRMARRCRNIVQACLREEEWADADREFYRVCREELEQWRGAIGRPGADRQRQP
jgi:hypothetical protein